MIAVSACCCLWFTADKKIDTHSLSDRQLHLSPEMRECWFELVLKATNCSLRDPHVAIPNNNNVPWIVKRLVRAQKKTFDQRMHEIARAYRKFRDSNRSSKAVSASARDRVGACTIELGWTNCPPKHMHITHATCTLTHARTDSMHVCLCVNL